MRIMCLFLFPLGHTPFSKDNRESSYSIYLRILENNISFPYGFDATTKELVSDLCQSDLSKRLIDPASIASHKYWEIPWDAVNARRLVPPFVPRISEPGDASHFDEYRDGNKPMEGASSSSANVAMAANAATVGIAPQKITNSVSSLLLTSGSSEYPGF